jgi:hypothetical protein
VPKYLATLTATIEIEATNAAAAKDALRQDRLLSLKVIGASSAIRSSRSRPHDLDWKWSVNIKDQKFTNLRKAYT